MKKLLALLCILALACGDDDSPSDAGPMADGSVDTATSDAGPAGNPLPCDETFEHRGHTGCQSTIDGLQVKYFPLEGGSVANLAVYLHGDTANGWYENFGFRPEILDWAQERNVLVLGAVATSSYDDDDSPAYGAAQAQQATELITLIETFRDAYGASTERAFYWGVSGGSWFISSQFVARMAPRMPGIYVANCGGSGGSFGWAWDPSEDTALRDDIAVYYNYGSEDFLADPAHGSHLDFEERGITSDELIHEGATHCDHPIAGPTIEFWERHL